MGFMIISAVPTRLWSTKPRQTRCGHFLMAFDIESDNIKPIGHYAASIPSNSWFGVDSVCFTMADRRCKVWGRSISIVKMDNTENNKNGALPAFHILCVDKRGNIELFEFKKRLRIVCKINNERPMNMGPLRSYVRVHDAIWFDNQSI